MTGTERVYEAYEDVADGLPVSIAKFTNEHDAMEFLRNYFEDEAYSDTHLRVHHLYDYAPRDPELFEVTSTISVSLTSTVIAEDEEGARRIAKRDFTPVAVSRALEDAGLKLGVDGVHLDDVTAYIERAD
jgi:hypothetical protein